MRTTLVVSVAVIALCACSKPQSGDSPQRRSGAAQQPKTQVAPRTPAPATPYSYAVLRHETPSEMQADSVVVVKVRVKNASTRPWPAKGPIQLGFYWTEDKGKRLAKEEGRALAPKDVAPDSSAAFICRVKAPKTPGTYTLVWDMIEPGIWFGNKGAKALRIPVVVR